MDIVLLALFFAVVCPELVLNLVDNGGFGRKTFPKPIYDTKKYAGDENHRTYGSRHVVVAQSRRARVDLFLASAQKLAPR